MQDNPFLGQIAEVSLDDDLPASLPLLGQLTPHHKMLLLAWVNTTQLDDDQREVVLAPTEGIHKVLANAGAGKTHTLIARAIYILATTDCQPQDLTLLTFTNRAAKEIKERYKKIVLEVTGLEKLTTPYIGTIHGFAYGLINKTEGYQQSIMQEGAGRSLLRRLIATELYPDNKEMREQRQIRQIHDTYQELIANNELHYLMAPIWFGQKAEIITWRNPSYTEHAAKLDLLNQTARSVNAGITSTPLNFIPLEHPTLDDATLKDIRAHYAAKAGVSLNELTTILQHFMTAKYTNRTFEFSDILYYPLVYLAQHPAKLAKLWTRPIYVFQDEAQDQDTVQYALLRMFAGASPNLLFCADTKQTLYYWRHARPDLTDHLDRVSKPELRLPGVISPSQPVHHHYLRTNYRSNEQLVELANLFAEGFTTRDATPSHAFKDPALGTLSIRIFEDVTKENKSIAKEIAATVRSGKRTWRDFAVLTRTNRALLDLEAAFIAERVPYHLKKDNRATTKQSTFRVMAAFYALSMNPRDVPSLCELLEPIAGLGDKFLLKLQTKLNGLFAADPKLTVDNFTLNQMPEVNPEQKQFKQLQQMLDLMVRPFLKKVRTGQFTIPQLNQELRMLYAENGNHEGQEKHTLSTKAFDWQFSETALQKVTRTLDYIYLTLGEDPEYQILPEVHKIAAIHGILALGSDDKEVDEIEDQITQDDVKSNRVVLATGHAFKGKQAPVVYVSNLRDLAPPKDDPEEEQRCWFYVAITRPQEQLILTASNSALTFKGQPMATKENLLLAEFTKRVGEWKNGRRAK